MPAAIGQTSTSMDARSKDKESKVEEVEELDKI